MFNIKHDSTYDPEYKRGELIAKGVEQGSLRAFEESVFNKMLQDYDELINKGEKETISKKEYDFLMEVGEDIKNMEKAIVKDKPGRRKSVFVRDTNKYPESKIIKGFFGEISCHPSDVSELKKMQVGDNINFTDQKGQNFNIKKLDKSHYSIVNPNRGFQDTVALDQ